MNAIRYKPIGIIHSPFKEPRDTAIQPAYAKPYVPEFDMREKEKIGWLESKVHNLSKIKDDGRFYDDAQVISMPAIFSNSLILPPKSLLIQPSSRPASLHAIICISSQLYLS